MKKKISFIMLALLIVSSCSNKELPPLDDIEQRKFLTKSFNLKQMPEGSISIYDSIARAFESSLDARTQTLFEIINQDIAKDNYNDILPKIVEIAGYKARYNPDFYFATLGSELETKPTPTNPVHRNTLSAVWDMIDFSLMYTAAKQSRTPSLLKTSLKRKAMQNITSDVKLAFYRVAGAEKIAFELEETERKLRTAIINLDKSPNKAELDSYKVALVENLNQVLALKKESIVAKLELSSLLGLGKYTDYAVQPPVDLTTAKLMEYSLDDLEVKALKRARNRGFSDMDSGEELLYFRQQVREILPDAEFGFRDKKDYDYFQNQAWEEAGLKISWNLINLINTYKAAITKEEKTSLYDVYWMAVGSSILSEVNIAYLRFSQSLKNFKISLLLSDIKDDIANQGSVSEIENISDLDKISKDIEAMIAKMKIYYSYGELKDAEDMLLISVGVKNYPTFISPDNVKIIADGKANDFQEPSIKVNLDGNIEEETWASGDNWLEDAASENNSAPIMAPQPIIPMKNSDATETEILIDVKKYSVSPDVVNQPAKATVVKKKIKVSPLRVKSLQIGSFKDTAKAQSAWRENVAKYPTLVNYNHKVESAFVKGNTVYRLFISGEEKDLRSFCSLMKVDLGGSCIIR